MKTFFLDGVYVSEIGLNQIKTLKSRMMAQRKPRGRGAMRGRAGIPAQGITRLMSTDSLKSDDDLDADLKGLPISGSLPGLGSTVPGKGELLYFK
jgi:hypothetical protein